MVRKMSRDAIRVTGLMVDEIIQRGLEKHVIASSGVFILR